MATLISLSIKTKAGIYENYTISVSDETDQYGNNVAMWVEQNTEQRQRKEKRTYVGNGKVIWTDGKAVLAEKKTKPENTFNQTQQYQKPVVQQTQVETNKNTGYLEDEDLPF
jgi:hypothetical protein